MNILALYSYKKDKKNKDINEKFKFKKIICIAIWSCDRMKKLVENKFNQKGFFICKKNKDDIYEKICFGRAFTYEFFIEKIKTGEIFFDSGMYYDKDKPNNRLYSQWRANEKFWNNNIIEEYS